VDRQRNDRLGRVQLSCGRFEQRRQILRGCTESDTHADSYSNSNDDSHGYSHGNGYNYTNADTQWLLCSQYFPSVWQRCYG
jgi:hypothetical protein